MAYSRLTSTYAGGPNVFSVNFPLGYLSQADVTARVNSEVDGLGAPVYRSLTWLTSGTVAIGGAALVNGDIVNLERTVSKIALTHDYAAGEIITEPNLDASFKQAIMVVHEVLDGRFGVLASNIDMGGYQIKNLGAGTAAGDAVNLTQLQNMTGNAPAYAAAAAASATTATTQAGVATTAQGVATAAANSAIAAALTIPSPGANNTVIVSNGTTAAYQLIGVANLASAFVTAATAAVLDSADEILFGDVSASNVTRKTTARVIRSIDQTSVSAAYTTVLSDGGKHILHPSADTTARVFTIDSNANVAYPIGTAITFVNQNAAGVVTIAITADTMRLAGAGTLGSRTLAANGVATALKITSTEWIISGSGLT